MLYFLLSGALFFVRRCVAPPEHSRCIRAAIGSRQKNDPACILAKSPERVNSAPPDTACRMPHFLPFICVCLSAFCARFPATRFAPRVHPSRPPERGKPASEPKRTPPKRGCSLPMLRRFSPEDRNDAFFRVFQRMRLSWMRRPRLQPPMRQLPYRGQSALR